MRSTIRKILAKSDPENRVKGQFYTVVAGTLVIVLNSGVLDSHPIAKSITDMVVGALAITIRKHALKTK